MADRFVRYFGLAAALLVPAAVFAQNLPDGFPQGFPANTLVRATALDAMRQEIVNLRNRVADLEDAQGGPGFGAPGQPLTSFTNGTNATRSLTMAASGLLVARGAGSAFDTAGIDISVPGVANLGRSRVGTSVLVPVRQGETVQVQVTGFAAPAPGLTNSIDVYLIPLN